ncbi:MAG: DUF3303 family protein [Bacteroidota bacterium]
MALFVVQHQHSPESCPAGDTMMAPMLLSQLSEQNAQRFGVIIQSEAVIDGGHTLYLTVEAPDRKSVEQFMQPFAQIGSVEVWPASHCEVVVERGAC